MRKGVLFWELSARNHTPDNFHNQHFPHTTEMKFLNLSSKIKAGFLKGCAQKILKASYEDIKIAIT
jgi:hypothetical protein